MTCIQKRKRGIARLFLLMIITTFIVSLGSMTVFAEQKDVTDKFMNDNKLTSTDLDNFDMSKSKEVDENYDGDVVMIGGKKYSVGVANSALTNSNVSKLDVNVKANVGAANDLVSGFEPVINLVIGILAWVIVIGLPLITALDVCYITIPFVREKAEDVKAGGGIGTKTGKDGSTKLRWISDEAQHAVETIDLDAGRSPLKTYLKSRIGAFVMVAIILYLLIGGQITVVTQLAVRLVSGIMNILSGLGS